MGTMKFVPLKTVAHDLQEKTESQIININANLTPRRIALQNFNSEQPMADIFTNYDYTVSPHSIHARLGLITPKNSWIAVLVACAIIFRPRLQLVENSSKTRN